MSQELIATDGEVGASFDLQVMAARQFPRNIQQAAERILAFVTYDYETAKECVYSLPRGGKKIEGPTIRMAEIIQQVWGNNRVAARILQVDRNEKWLEAEGLFQDLESNSTSVARVRRSICDSDGRIFREDMIIMTGNAACSIAKRNAILEGVPRLVWGKAEVAAKKIVAGGRGLAESRRKALASFADWGVEPQRIYSKIGVTGLEDITSEHLSILRQVYRTLKSGKSSIEEAFRMN